MLSPTPLSKETHRIWAIPTSGLGRGWGGGPLDPPPRPALSLRPCVCPSSAWAAQPGGLGDNVPLTFGTSGVQGRGRSNENDLCFYSRQFLFSAVQVYISAFCLKTERWNVRPTGALPKESLWKNSLCTCYLRHKMPVQTISGLFWDILPGSVSDVNPLILVLVFKDSLRSKFKSLSLSLQV